RGQHGGLVVSTVGSQLEGSWFVWRFLSMWSLHVLAWVSSGYSGFLPQSKDMHVRLIDNSKIALSE
ncbi:MAG: hypothetical protein AAFV85_28435, partial [Cyanobacteria bacterium J06634_6]